MSFATNTNWQGYAGETTLSYLTQMLGLTVQNFVSAATGMAVLVALIRGFARRTSATVGSFWVDLVRSTVHVLLPLSIVLAPGAGRRAAWCRPSSGPATVQLLDPLAAADGSTSTEQVDPARPGRIAGRDQAARHERRGLLQRELRASRSRTPTR